MAKLVFVDIETGGLKWWEHEHDGIRIPMNPIIQIGALVVDACAGVFLDEFEAKLQFDEGHCVPKALAVNGYDREVWEKRAWNVQDARINFDSFFAAACDGEEKAKFGRC